MKNKTYWLILIAAAIVVLLIMLYVPDVDQAMRPFPTIQEVQ